jgi:penicillin-binding protein-related factor A (putative recombinase)
VTSKPKWLDAEAEFESWFTTKKSFCFKFHDARMAKGTGGSNRIFTASHPADYVVVDKGVMFYAEVKSSQDPISFPFASIQKSQWSAAMRTHSAGGSYFFFIKSEHRHCWYRVPAEVMLPLREGVSKSVKWEHLAPLIWNQE